MGSDIPRARYKAGMPGGGSQTWCGRTLAERYRLESVVGEGGFGVVYRAHQVWLDVPVAVKVLRTSPDWSIDRQQAMLSRFLVEAQLLAQLRHPNIVAVLDTGVEPALGDAPATPWLVTEWCDGESLAALLQRRGSAWPIAEAWSLLEPVVEALAHAHQRGIVHRDLKPSNIMVVEDDGRMAARVLDFGIAKLGEHTDADAVATESDETAFTLAYASPEQLARERTGPWTDVHALALLFCELLRGHRPYVAESRQALHEAVFSPVRPSPVPPGRAEEACDQVLSRALSLDPKQRQQNASELLADLRGALPAALTHGSGSDLVSGSTQRSEAFRLETAPEPRMPKPAAAEAHTRPDAAAAAARGLDSPPPLPRARAMPRWLLPMLALTALIAIVGALNRWRPGTQQGDETAISRKAGATADAAAPAPAGSNPSPAPTAHPPDCFDAQLLLSRALHRGWSLLSRYDQEKRWGIETTTLVLTSIGSRKPRSATVIFYRHDDKPSQVATLSYLNTPKYHVSVRSLCAVAVLVAPDGGEGDALMNALTK
jgi:serine/threonine-protein kinase